MPDQDTLDKLVAQKAEGGFTKQELADISRQAKKLKDVNVNLAHARMAVRFVLQKVKHVANWDERLEFSAEAIYITEFNKAEAQSQADRSKAKSPAEFKLINEKFSQEVERAKKKSEDAWTTADRCVYGKLRQDPEWKRIKTQGG